MVIVKDTESFIAKSRTVHGDRYDYSQTFFIGSQSPITIVCKECGPFRLASAQTHYGSKKCGCGKCNHALAIDKKRKHPKKQKNWCKKCGCETYKRSSICKNCISPESCLCGKTVRARHSKHCEHCYAWGKSLKSRLSEKCRRQRKIEGLNTNVWLGWAVIKQSLLLSRSRLSVDRQERFAVVNEQWCNWADSSVKTKLRGIESAWQKKCRNWQRGLSRRSRVERS
jgi:hypothetical protein